MKVADIPKNLLKRFRKGCVIPAMPLALDENREFSAKHQRAILRYQIDAGVGGIAVGVHSTQFEIREPGIDLFEPVLKFAATEIDSWCEKQGAEILKIAGVCGKTEQALEEAEFVQSTGYQACLLSLAALADEKIDSIIEHCKKVSTILPIIGFYLQPAVGGRVLPFEFWRKFAMLDNVLGIKMAPFNRYQTFDVVRAVAEAGRENDITLYTGNDDNIIVDLLTEFKIQTADGEKKLRIQGGLLGHWAVWTKKAVELLDEINAVLEKGEGIPDELLARAIEVTDSNAAFFDSANAFAGCIPGIHEVLRRQGIFAGTWCLNKEELMSPGQKEEIDRVYKSYTHLNDDDFVKANLDKWLED